MIIITIISIITITTTILMGTTGDQPRGGRQRRLVAHPMPKRPLQPLQGKYTPRVQVVLIYGFGAPKSLNNDYLDP